jgi:hypothetical protein
MCFMWLSGQTVTFALYIISILVFITEVESVYSAVRTESLYNTETFLPLKVKIKEETSKMLYLEHSFIWC